MFRQPAVELVRKNCCSCIFYFDGESQATNLEVCQFRFAGFQGFLCSQTCLLSNETILLGSKGELPPLASRRIELWTAVDHSLQYFLAI
jgi:hypothetical protein